jgi:hypothetical protein
MATTISIPVTPAAPRLRRIHGPGLYTPNPFLLSTMPHSPGYSQSRSDNSRIPHYESLGPS